MTKLVKEKVPWLLFVGIFIYFYIFFSRVAPIIIRSGDDWTYIGSWRVAVPTLKEWNPSKIFPETVMPMIAYLAVYLVMPFTKDYIGSFTLTYAFFVALIITVYIYSFYQYIKCKFGLSETYSTIISLMFLILHYLIFNNAYLLQIGVINNYFNYTIPTLLNIMLVLFMERLKIKDLRSFGWIKGGVFFLLIYLAIFSNMYSNYLLAVYAGMKIMRDFLAIIRKRPLYNSYKLVEWIKQRFFYIIIIGFWGTAALFEMSGERAAKARETSEGSYISALKETFANLKGQLSNYNKIFLFFIIVVTVITVFALWNERKKNTMLSQEIKADLLRNMISGVVSLIYLILLSAMVKPSYIKNMDVLFGPCFFLIYCVSVAMIYILTKSPWVMTGIPLLLYIFVFFIGNSSLRNIPNLQSYVDLDNYYIEQFEQADQEGLTEFTLDAASTVPSYFGNRMARTLYRHGIVSKQMNVETKCNPEVDKMFGIQ